MQGRRRGHGLVAIALVLAGCTDLFGPGLPDGAVPLEVLPAEYQEWWSIVEQCADLEGTFERVEWWHVPTERTLKRGDNAVGQYLPGTRQIVLAGLVTLDGYVVRHEMLHAILDEIGLTGHPPEYFEARCGGVVSCGGRCEETARAERPSMTGLTPLHPQHAGVTIDVFPATMSRTPGLTGCSTVVVTVENRGPSIALLHANAHDDFDWTVEGWGTGSGGGPVPPNDRIILDRGSRRSYAYDCPGPFAILEAGDYTILGRWQGAESPEAPLTVVP